MPPRADRNTLQLLFKFVILSGASRKTESDIFVYFYNQFGSTGREQATLQFIGFVFILDYFTIAIVYQYYSSIFQL